MELPYSARADFRWRPRGAATIGLQSSGILIQPWRMAYTTA